MINPWNMNDECSHCGKIGETIWHVCKACTAKAQIEYNHECALLANDAFNKLNEKEIPK